MFAALWTAAAQPAVAADVCPEGVGTGQNFSGQDLRDRNFSGQNLVGADFTNARLEGAVFTDADLASADFSGANLGLSTTNGRATSFSRADLENACFAGATIIRTDFKFADLPCTVFAATDLTTAVFGPVIKAAPPGGACRTSFADASMGCEFIPQWKDLELKRARIQGCFDRLAQVDFSGSTQSIWSTPSSWGRT